MTEKIVSSSEGNSLRVNRVPAQNEAEKRSVIRAYRNPNRRIKETA